MYRFQKFARKHQPALAAAVAIALCLLLGTTVSAWQAVRATTAEAQANANEQKAVANEQKANAQRDEAQRQRDEIKNLNDTLQATQGELRSTLYTAHMNLAKHTWDSNNQQPVLELLEQHRPKPGQNDNRGFEWHYLNRLCQSELLTLTGHSAAVKEAAYSPDGRRLATASGKEVKVWDAQSGKELFSYRIESGTTRGMKYSPDGKRLAGAGNDLKIIWDGETGRELLSIKHGDESFAFSPDGRCLASGAAKWNDEGDNVILSEVKVWDSQSGKELLSLRGGGISVTYSPDGKRLASSSYDGSVRVWETNGGQQLLSLQSSGVFSHPIISFSPDGKLLAATGDEDTKVWNAWTGRLVSTLKDESADNVAFSPEGKYLATAWSHTRTVNLWNPTTGKQVRTIRGPSDVRFSPDGSRLASPSRDNTAKIWDAHRDQEFTTLPTDGGAAFVFSSDWSSMAHSTEENTLKIRDVATGREVLELSGHTILVRHLIFSPDGKRLASGAGGQRWSSGFGIEREHRPEVKLWNADTGRELFTFPMPSGAVFAMAFSPDGKRLAAVSFSPPHLKTVTLTSWDVVSGREFFSLKGKTGRIRSLVYSPDSKRLASSHKVFDAETGQELFLLGGNADDVAFTPDGKHLATWGGGGVKLWDAHSGKEFQTIKAGLNGMGLVFSPDGRRIATAHSNGNLALLDAQTGLEVLSLERKSDDFFPYHNQIVAFSPDGHRLACTGPDGAARIYDATPLPEKP